MSEVVTIHRSRGRPQLSIALVAEEVLAPVQELPVEGRPQARHGDRGHEEGEEENAARGPGGHRRRGQRQRAATRASAAVAMCDRGYRPYRREAREQADPDVAAG